MVRAMRPTDPTVLRPRSGWRALCTALLASCLAALPVHAQTNEEVPFIASPDNVTLEMLRIAGVGASDRLIDLGSGDGRIVIATAKKFGAKGLGLELDPKLVQLSREAARAAMALQVERARRAAAGDQACQQRGEERRCQPHFFTISSSRR